MERVVLHIDMDAFYASVEQLDHPELRGKPVIVGGSSNRGVVSAASYEARKFGVRSAMPIFQAKKRCPDGIFVPVRMSRYKQMSDQVMEILEKYSPPSSRCRSMKRTSISLVGAPSRVARANRETDQDEIRSVLSLSCSVGIAANKFLAKVASESNSPTA